MLLEFETISGLKTPRLNSFAKLQKISGDQFKDYASCEADQKYA